MDNNIWVEAAQRELPEGPPHKVMQRANELAEVNSQQGRYIRKPFAQVDINFTELLDSIRVTKNQRELDLVYVTNLYHRAWSSLHLGMGTMGEVLSPGDEEEVRGVYAALLRLGMGKLITNGLSKKCNRWLLKA